MSLNLPVKCAKSTLMFSLISEICDSANTNTYSNIQERQPKTCQELWRRCEVLCSSINPLERIKYQGSGCCRMSPIPTTDDFKLLFEPLFSRRTTFAFYKEVFHVDQRCTCMKFNGIEEECKHPECKQNLKCLSIPLATCSPAENWKKYYGQTS